LSETNSKFIINGGKPLHGSVKVSGAKNSASKLLVASLLTNEKCILHNSPNKISDLTLTKEICESLGSKIKIDNDILVLKQKRYPATASKKTQVIKQE
jgi:UDP-N-acetylglucosamine 1-carboxyvinyltransferase